MSVGEDGKVGVHGWRCYSILKWRSGMLDGGWNCIWDDCRVSVEENTEVGEVMSLLGLADEIWSEVVLSEMRKNLGEWKGGNAVNVCDFGGAVRELWKIIWYFGLKGVVVADSDWDEDDWESGLSWKKVWTG